MRVGLARMIDSAYEYSNKSEWFLTLDSSTGSCIKHKLINLSPTIAGIILD
jgi:hypothetical protein